LQAGRAGIARRTLTDKARFIRCITIGGLICNADIVPRKGAAVTVPANFHYNSFPFALHDDLSEFQVYPA
jgi:hypothetical protein